jgi:hypothetical protein
MPVCYQMFPAACYDCELQEPNICGFNLRAIAT